jgi:hypothetical protein
MFTQKEREHLRQLAGKVREIAERPEMKVRRLRLMRLNALKPERPVLLCFPEGGWDEILNGQLQCEDSLLREWESGLFKRVWWWENIRDDNFETPWFNIPRKIDSSNWEPSLKNLDKDLEKLKFRVHREDKPETSRRFQLASELFNDLLPVRVYSTMYWWSLGLTNPAMKLYGHQELLLAMAENPEGVKRLMSFLQQDTLRMIEWYEKEGILCLNNNEAYVGSGGVGATDDLPQKDWKEGMPVRLKDLWGFAESQETQDVSPRMFEELVLPFLIPLFEKFGLNCYGCCEPLDQTIDPILKLRNMRRISVSPWADQEVMARKLGKHFVFSRKPNPALVTSGFDEQAIRDDFRKTLKIAGDGALEIILKDTSTVQNDLARFAKWVKIGYEEIDRFMMAKK